MVQWEGTKQVGLSPGQTEGEVEGTYVIRDPSSDITKTYVEAESIQTTSGYPGDRVLVEVAGQKYYTGKGDIPEIGSYKRETGFTSTRRIGMMTPAEVEQQYQQQRGIQPVQQVPSPFQAGQVQYAPYSPFGKGIIAQQQQYPSTPIDYSRTHVSELSTYPLYKGAAYVSKGLQIGLEAGISVLPIPEQVKEVGRGFGSLFTGIPEFVASGIAGWEYATREPTVFKEGIVPAIKMFGVGVAAQAIERPFYTGGQVIGFVSMMRGGIGGRQTKLLEAPKIEPLRIPGRQLLPQAPKGMEGLEILKLPERPGVYKPVVIEGVKSIREPSAIPEQYRAALERGSAPISERGVYGMQFGSKGYRPTGAAKPENIFTSGEFKRFIKEEKAVSYVPTFERLRAEPQIKPRVQVITAEKAYVLPSLRTLQTVKTAPKTSIRIAAIPKTSTRTALMSDILVQTRPKTAIQPLTRASTKIAIMPELGMKVLSKSMVKPSTITKISIMPSVQTKTALKSLTQTRTQPLVRTQTMFDLDLQKKTKVRTKDMFKGLKVKTTFGRGGFKFPELSKVATPKEIMKGFRL